MNAVPAWTKTHNWTAALLAFKIHFGDRLPDKTTDAALESADSTSEHERPVRLTGDLAATSSDMAVAGDAQSGRLLATRGVHETTR